MRFWLLLLSLVGACGREAFHDACIDLPPGCIDGMAYKCNGRCYAVCPQLTTQPTASVMCTEWGGCPATVRDPQDNDCAASRLSDNAWLGGRQANTASRPDEGWSWCDGSPFAFTWWAPGEPNDLDSVGGNETGLEQCVRINPGGDWHDVNCANMNHVVCARDP
jgi:hypothetical protein